MFPTPHYVITNFAYKLKPHHKRNQYLRAILDTCADVNIMPASVYKLVFQDPDCKKLAPSKLEIGTYTTNTVKLVGSCMFYLLHPDTKHLLEVTFYVASNNDSVSLSCATTLALGLIQPLQHTGLDYLPPRIITRNADHPKKTKSQMSVHVSKKESEVSNCKGMLSELITSKDQILANCSDVLKVLDAFLVPHTIFRWIPVSHQSKPPADQSPVHLKEAFKKELTRYYKPVNLAIPRINSFVLVEGKDKQGNLKLRICLDLTNLNKAIVQGPYHFKTPEAITHLLAEACLITIWECRKGNWHQQLDETSSFLTTFNTELVDSSIQ